MPAFAWLFLLLAPAQDAPQQEVAPYGWGCDVVEDMGSGVRMAISQTADGAGDTKYPRIIRVDYSPSPPGGDTQSIHWTAWKGEADLPRATSLALSLKLKKRDRKGEIRFEHDGGTISLPVLRLRLYPGHEASIDIDDLRVMEALSTTTHWRVSVLDRHGVVQGSADGLLPPRDESQKAFHRLAPILAGKIAVPEGQCGENDVTAWI
ncbi:MAG: hypothetical protein WC729_05490 [Sphingomonas sp.]|jgi:hypothetical protein|uniref:hypothetical protein n=1 Tax=Sphingomonas sp. TaxID=28214 RepID=UPI0035680903